MQVKPGRAALAVLALSLLAAGCAGSDRPAPKTPQGEVNALTTGQEERGWLARVFDGSADQPNAGPCPLLGVLYDSSRLVEFKQPGERFANVGFTGEIRGVRGLCRYTATSPIELAMEIDMAFGRGPLAEGSSRTYRYWVAVTRKDQAPIHKEYFDVTVEFPRGVDRMAGPERIEKIVIPRANETISGANFEVLVGFDLTPEQVEFNRAGKRFRVDVAGAD